MVFWTMLVVLLSYERNCLAAVDKESVEGGDHFGTWTVGILRRKSSKNEFY